MPKFMQNLLTISLMTIFFMMVGACASSSEGEEEAGDELANTENGGEEAAEVGENTGEENETGNEANENAEENTLAETEVPAEPAAEPAAPAANVPPANVAAPAPNTAVAAPVAVSGEGREVRFVQKDDTPVFQSASDSATQVVRLHQGDIVVVQVQGEWAQITADRFVKMAALSKKAVPRNFFPAVWLEAGVAPNAAHGAPAPGPNAGHAPNAAPAPNAAHAPNAALAPNAAAPGPNAGHAPNAAPGPNAAPSGNNAAAPAPNASMNAQSEL